MKKKIILIISFIVIIFLVILGTYGLINNNPILSNEVNISENEKSEYSNASEFILQDLDGNSISLSELKGKKVFLNFWATWCYPCQLEMPYIQEIKNEYDNIEIITINASENIDTVEKFMTSENYNFKVLLDLDGKVSSKYKAYSIPTSYLIDEEGYIIDKHTGTMTKQELIIFMGLNN